MAKIVKTVVFVTYSITPISAAFEESLERHLFKEVWGDRSEADEDICVLTNTVNNNKMITEVRYQFGYSYDEDRAEEIGELIDEQISRWADKTSVWEVLED